MAESFPAAQTQTSYQFEDCSKPGQAWWLSLVAVDRDGRESARSEPVRVTHPGVGGKSRAKIEDPFTLSGPRRSENAAGSAPAAPSDLRAVDNPANDVIRLSWSSPGGDRFAFKRGDLVLLDRRATEFNRDLFSPGLPKHYARRQHLLQQRLTSNGSAKN